MITSESLNINVALTLFHVAEDEGKKYMACQTDMYLHRQTWVTNK